MKPQRQEGKEGKKTRTRPNAYSIAGGTAEVQSESQGESAAGDGYAIKCCNNKGKQEQQKTVDPTT